MLRPSMKRAVFLALLAVAGSAYTQGYSIENYKTLRWENVGPNRGGRSIACVGSRMRPNEYYFGATGGGVWKTTDAGASWACVSDGFFKSSSVGALAVCDSNPDVVYAGMGERDIRGNIAEGDGVYKSTDAGKTWTHVGLENCRTISRIVVDPRDPNTVYVAALGHVWKDNQARGVYKSTDGGQTWRTVLFESPQAGAVELVMDPADSHVLYAATWDAWRRPWYLNSGGPGSKMWKSTDAGEHWTDVTRSAGLPSGTLGKIGIAPLGKRVYAIVEAAEGGIFRSDDAGSSWTRVTDDSEWRQRAWYFSHVYVDPKNADHVFCLNVGAGESKDGGKTWSGMRTPHSDNHDLWLNPDDPKQMIEANDGGASVSKDGGGSWSAERYPTAQLYHVVADNHVPYKIYGAQQDNSSVMLSPSDPDTPQKRNFQGTAGGESGWIAVRWDDPERVYGGNYGGDISEIDYRTNMRKNLDPWPDNPMGHGAIDLKHRFQWTFPILTSPHDPNVLYTASQFLLRTEDDGQTWKQISPDLTRNDKSKQKSSGGPLTQDNTSIEYYDTIFCVAESPVKKGVIWVGTDDGLVQVTQNGGGSWQNVTPPKAPEWGRVSMVEASPHDAATCYAAINNYQNDDLGVYIYKTHDYGHTWTQITDGIPAGSFARVCREDLHRAGLLYAGTETGVFVSFDDGSHWQPLQQNLPLCPVHDLVCKDDDLIAATHGRSFWIMHNLSRLAYLTPGQASGPILYGSIDRVRTGFGTSAQVGYYLPREAKDVKFEVFNAKNELMGSGTGDTSAGFQSASVSLSHRSYGNIPGAVFWGAFPRPIPAPPGVYTVRMTVDGQTQTKQIRILRDPRVRATDKDLQEQYDFSVQVSDRVNVANKAVMRIRDMRSQIDATMASPKADAQVKTQGAALNAKLLELEGSIHQYRSKSGEDPLNFPIGLNNRLAALIGVVQSGQMAPSLQARQVFSELSSLLDERLGALKTFESRELTPFNNLLTAKGIPTIVPKDVALQEGGGRRRGGEEDEDK